MHRTPPTQPAVAAVFVLGGGGRHDGGSGGGVQGYASVHELFEFLSAKENELLQRIEQIQQHLQTRVAAAPPTRGIAAAPPLHGDDMSSASPSMGGGGGGAATAAGSATSSPARSGEFIAADGLTPRNMAVRVRESAGDALSAHDGRTGFLLAFGAIDELYVTLGDGKGEAVNVFFGGTAEEPLLVQRIGKAREEAAAASDGPAAGTSGAKAAAPQLGYVEKREVVPGMTSEEEATVRCDVALYHAAQAAAAAHWKHGKTRALAIPPRGLQWELGAAHGEEEAAEAAVRLTAELVDPVLGRWAFTIAGKAVEPLDARACLSPCSAPSKVESIEAGSDRFLLLQRALYAHPHTPAEGNSPWAKADGGDEAARSLGLQTELDLFERLHAYARAQRAAGVREGVVYDWEGLAASGVVVTRTWRDALLCLTTREADHMALGPVGADGSGTGRDMTEGVLYRIFHALECLYPATLIKEGALRWRVIPRGAAYHHLLDALTSLGRGVVAPSLGHKTSAEVPTPRSIGIDSGSATGGGATSDTPSAPDEAIAKSGSKRPRRKAADNAAAAASAIALDEAGGSRAAPSSGGDAVVTAASTSSAAGSVHRARAADGTALAAPRITSTLWEHQARSVAATLAGGKGGKLGFADASAVGAGKTLTALATVVELSAHLDAIRVGRHGALVMLPEPNLIKEWLLELGKHTSGFHVVEQRETGELFSLTYAKKNPPIDANTIVISTLDRVSAHPFVRQAAWDFVVIDECLAVQNAAAKRCPSAWRQIEVSTCGCLMLSATFFRSKFANLFYMIRMLRSPLPRTLEFLPALVHEHIVCEVPETDRSWELEGDAVPLSDGHMAQYRGAIDAFERRRLNLGDADGLRLTQDLQDFLRGGAWEGRGGKDGQQYGTTSPLAQAFVKKVQQLLKQGRRPLVFANTEAERGHLLKALRTSGVDAVTWRDVQAADRRPGGGDGRPRPRDRGRRRRRAGRNMQHDADTIVCRPTPGDHRADEGPRRPPRPVRQEARPRGRVPRTRSRRSSLPTSSSRVTSSGSTSRRSRGGTRSRSTSRVSSPRAARSGCKSTRSAKPGTAA